MSQLIECIGRVEAERYHPLINQVMSWNYPETEYTKDLKGEVRNTKTLEFLLRVLEGHARKHKRLVFIIENIHWLDTMSFELLLRCCDSSAMWFLLTSRTGVFGELEPHAGEDGADGDGAGASNQFNHRSEHEINRIPSSSKVGWTEVETSVDEMGQLTSSYGKINPLGGPSHMVSKRMIPLPASRETNHQAPIEKFQSTKLPMREGGRRLSTEKLGASVCMINTDDDEDAKRVVETGIRKGSVGKVKVATHSPQRLSYLKERRPESESKSRKQSR